MSPMTFPKMLFSHEQGWSWLMRVHPSAMRLYLAYALPLSLIPPAMLFYMWYRYQQAWLPGISMNEALALCFVFLVAEMIMVPVMAQVIRRIGNVVGIDPPYQDAFTLAAVAPTPLWLAPLSLFVPSAVLIGLALTVAVIGAGLLIYQGSARVFQVDDPGKATLLAGSVIAAGLVAWIAMMLATFVLWGAVVGGY